jgi:hypothetical protein
MNSRWRYRIVVTLIWSAVSAAALAGWFYARASGPAYGPVIIVSVESLRADRLPVYGYTRVRTPAIDALAADSVIFDRAYSHSPLTLPSTVSLLSGLLPFQSGVRDDIGFAVPPAVSLLPQWLHKRGFKTGGVVSSCLLASGTGLGAAFGFFDDAARGGEAAGATGVAADCARDGAKALGVAEHWIESADTARFFLFLHLDAPAAPTSPAVAAARPSKLTPYDARIAYADDLLGQLIAFLKKRGLYNGGILILTSDHGEGFGDRGEQGHGLLLDEHAVRTPLIVKMPRRDGGGRHSDALVAQTDIAPTILDLVGAPRNSKLGGRSLRRVLDSPTAILPDRPIYAETLLPRFQFGWGESASLTTRDARYIGPAHPVLLDLSEDTERRVRETVAAGDPAAESQLRPALEAMLKGLEMPVPSPVSEEDRARFEAIGRVAGMPGPLPAVPADQLADPKEFAPVGSRYFEACRLAAGGRTDEAIALLRAVVAEFPSLAAGWDRLTALLLARERFAEAGDALVSLLKLYPDAERAEQADRRVPSLLGPSPDAERFAAVEQVWTALGEKGKASSLRALARKTVGESALRKAEASLRKR